MAKDYYKILGVDKSATDAEIKKAFRKLAHEHHPDKSSGNEAKFKEINEAYQVLGNKEKRSQYDQFGTTFDGPGGQGGFGGGNPFGQGFGGFRQGFGGAQGGAQNIDFDLGDIFGDFFGGGGASRGGFRSRRGSDIEVDIEISLKEAVFGIEKTISIRKQNQCEGCKGSGAKNNSAYDNCPTCNGSGKVSTSMGIFTTQTVCPECQGMGKIIKEKCALCNGAGSKMENVDIKVQIPAGINEGQAVRLAGKGNAGQNGAASGDLYINVHVNPEEGFEREGFDLVTEYDVPFTMAALGGEIEVKTIDGKVKLKIPSGTPSGKKFILKGKGVTHLKSSGRGDQVVIVNVEVPTKLNKKQKELLQELDKELANKNKSWF